MSELDPRAVYWVIWGVGVVVVYAILFRRARRHYNLHHDARAWRDQVRAFGYFLVSIAAGIGITFALYFRGNGMAAIAFAVAGGAFLVNGVYAVMDAEPESGNREARRQ